MPGAKSFSVLRRLHRVCLPHILLPSRAPRLGPQQSPASRLPSLSPSWSPSHGGCCPSLSLHSCLGMSLGIAAVTCTACPTLAPAAHPEYPATPGGWSGHPQGAWSFPTGRPPLSLPFLPRDLQQVPPPPPTPGISLHFHFAYFVSILWVLWLRPPSAASAFLGNPTLITPPHFPTTPPSPSPWTMSLTSDQ